MKLRSSLTLFMRAAPDEILFSEALRIFYEGGEVLLVTTRTRRPT